MMQLFIYDSEKFTENRAFDNIDELDGMLQQKSVIWINKHGLAEREVITQLCDKLDAHRLLKRDLFDLNQRTNLEVYDNHLFFTVRSLFTKGIRNMKTEQMSFMLGSNYLISFQERKGDHFESIRDRIRYKEGIVRDKGPDYLLYLILSRILSGYKDRVFEIEKDIEEEEKMVMDNTDMKVIIDLEKLKSSLLFLRKNLLPFKDVTTTLEKGHDAFIVKKNLSYFSDLKDQCLNLLDEIEMHRQSLESMSNIFYSGQSHRMNEVMKTLTIVATIFIPLTFIAGIYGMNFQNMPELGWTYGYYAVLGIMVLMVVAMFWYFKRQKWF